KRRMCSPDSVRVSWYPLGTRNGGTAPRVRQSRCGACHRARTTSSTAKASASVDRLRYLSSAALRLLRAAHNAALAGTLPVPAVTTRPYAFLADSYARVAVTRLLATAATRPLPNPSPVCHHSTAAPHWGWPGRSGLAKARRSISTWVEPVRRGRSSGSPPHPAISRATRNDCSAWRTPWSRRHMAGRSGGPGERIRAIDHCFGSKYSPGPMALSVYRNRGGG